MSFQELYQVAATFEEFLDTDKDIHKEKTLEIYKAIQLDEDLLLKIKSIDSSIYILAFAEIWCPDCMINVPVLQKIVDVNPNIQLKFLPREGNENYIDCYKVAGKAKIPTFIVLNANFEEKGVFIENPKVFKTILTKGNEVESIVAKRKYRKGEYIKETIEEIVDIIMRK